MSATKPVVLLAEELSPATIEALGPDFEIRQADGADRAALLSAIVDVDAILVRSATQVDAEAIAAAKNLKVIARAGVGLDNVDIKAATQAGVMVVNAPTSNIVSAAELTIGHVLSLARHIPAASTALKNGEWKRSKYTGTELLEKKLGIIGLGRIGALITERAKAFGMDIVAYDPYVTSARAASLGVQLLTLDELLEQSDFITIHMPRTPETLGMIGTEAFKKMKKSAYVINVARGGLIDEAALNIALREGEIAGAGIDVFVKEPATDVDFLELDNVFTALTHASVTQIDVEVAGEIAALDVKALELSALKGVFKDVVSEQVSYVNAPILAEQRGINTRLITTLESTDYRNVLTIRGALSDDSQISVSGTLTGPKQIQKIVAVNGYELEIPMSDHLLVISYADRPGVVGTLGRLLGENGVNIAGMQVARHSEGGQALALITVDSTVPQSLLEDIKSEIGATMAREVDLED